MKHEGFLKTRGNIPDKMQTDIIGYSNVSNDHNRKNDDSVHLIDKMSLHEKHPIPAFNQRLSMKIIKKQLSPTIT